MTGETTLTVIGNLTADPDLRHTPTGTPVAHFPVASTPRTYDRQGGQWRDGQPLFLRCTLWRQPAEHATATLAKGARVIVTGRLTQRHYETSQGEARTVTELDVDELGPSLRYTTATINKPSRNSATPRSRADSTSGSGDDPWGSAPAPDSSAGGDDEPPF